MKQFLKYFYALPLAFILLFSSISPVLAAQMQTGENLTIPADKTDLRDLYLFGQAIQVDAPITNDLVVGGGNITINNNITGSLLAAGGNITTHGPIGNTARVAGGEIIIDDVVANDLVVAGGTVTVTKNASIGGDILFSGGKLQVQGPVQKNVIVNGGEITIDAPVNGSIQGHINKLTLGPNAIINGSLTYTSPNKVSLASGAVVKGTTKYTPAEKSENEKTAGASVFGFGSIYKLLVDIILSVLFIFFFGKFIQTTLSRMKESPLKNGAIGFAFFFLFPIAALIALLLIWLGITAFLFYAFILLITIFLVKVFIGWALMHWYEKRNKHQYVLDWKAGIVGPIVVFILLLIPILGWLTLAILFLIALGSLLQEIITIAQGQKLGKKPSQKK